VGARPASTGSMVTVIGSLRYRSEIHGDFACVDMPGLYRPKGARLRRIHRELANPQAQVSSPFFPSFQLPEPFATDRIPLPIEFRRRGSPCIIAPSAFASHASNATSIFSTIDCNLSRLHGLPIFSIQKPSFPFSSDV